MIERHVRDDLGAYALGALEPDERATVERHIAGCAACRADVEDYREALWKVAEAGPLPTEPADLRERIVARHRSAGRSAWRSWPAAIVALLRRPVPALAPMALALLLVVAAAALLDARRDADAYARALAGVASGRVVPLAPQDAQGRGALVIPERGQPYLVLELPAPPSGTTWEAWVIRGERPIAAGISDVRRGVFTIVLTQALAPGDGVAVTLEQAGGVDRPTSRPVLVGRT